MIKKNIIIIAAVIVAILAVSYYVSYKNEIIDTQKPDLISPAQIQALDSREEKRKYICENAFDAISKKVCGSEYDFVGQNDTKKIDELFIIMDRLEKDKEISDYDRFMLAKLIFLTLPVASDEFSVNKKMPVASSYEDFIKDLLPTTLAQENSLFISRAEYEKTLLNDLIDVRSNCPADGYQNWILDVSCSEYNEGGVVYSKEYFESGGPCANSSAGQSEATHIKSIVNNKMKSEYNFTNEKGTSSQIACSFTCASHNCPALENEIKHPSCKNGSTIYIPMHDARKEADISAKRFEIADEHAEIECEERGYDYESTYSGGRTERTKNLECAIIGERSGEGHIDPVTNRFIYYLTYCCSCEKPYRRIPFVHMRDYMDDKPKKNDILQKLFDGYKEFEKERDAPVKAVPDINPKAAPDIASPSPEIVIPSSTPEKKPAVPQDICCYNSKAKIGEQYYIPFDGSDCLSGDERVPLDNKCNNPLLY